MSNSQQLSKTIRKHAIASKESFSQQEKVVSAREMVIKKVRQKYPQIHFEYRKRITKIDIRSSISDLNPEFGKNISNKGSFIQPDGGFLFAYFNGEPKMILSCEAKKQGTNNLRRLKGLDEQAMGNAVERTSKNYLELSQYLSKEDIFPYLIFISGDDFKRESNLRDRLTANNFQCPFNKLYIYKKEAGEINGHIQYASIPSIFIREKQWSVPEIRNKMLKAVEISIQHYLKTCTKVGYK